MNTTTTFFSAAAIALSLLAATVAQAQPVMKDGVLTDAAGRTVYTFDKDEADKSNCTGACLAMWPAFVAKPGAAATSEFSIIDTQFGRQWTVNGKPLYYYAADAKPGDRNGDGKGGVWHVYSGRSKSKAAAYSAY